MKFSAIRNELVTDTATGVSIKGTTLSEKKLISTGYMLYNPIYITFSKWGIFIGEKVSACQGLGLGGSDHSRVTRQFLRGDEIVLHPI